MCLLKVGISWWLCFKGMCHHNCYNMNPSPTTLSVSLSTVYYSINTHKFHPKSKINMFNMYLNWQLLPVQKCIKLCSSHNHCFTFHKECRGDGARFSDIYTAMIQPKKHSGDHQKNSTRMWEFHCMIHKRINEWMIRFLHLWKLSRNGYWMRYLTPKPSAKWNVNEMCICNTSSPQAVKSNHPN